ncbi:hypothetical protein [Blastomonas sp.]|uniref:hypothetical protein n=1 Tax=Blastomonas sp. TaxID=1909299 RepID=UPI002629F022|nr:hypothetical protein [Blastomonas sp.]MDM7957890.1 hypothetical protein [Blastomonas sp.]
MTHTSHPIRPARAAIAAVLALTATPLLAQEAPATMPALPQPEAMQPISPTGTIPPTGSIPTQTPQVQVPSGQPAVPTTAAPTPNALPPAASLPGNPMPMATPVAPPATSGIPVTTIAPRADIVASPPPAPRATPAQRAAAPTAAPAAPTAPEPTQGLASTEAPAAPLADAAPVSEETTAVVPVAPVASAPAQPEITGAEGNSGSGDVWSWMAGLLALLGIGGGAIALSRGRTRKSARAMAEARAADREPGRSEAGITTPVPAPSTARFDEPVMQTPTVAPMAAARPMARRAPVVARDTLTVDERRVEEMIAQKPSRDNPFKTRANRKRRAIWLLRTSYPMQSAA